MRDAETNKPMRRTKKRQSRSDAGAADIRYKALFDQSPDGLLIIDAKGNFLDFNEAAHRQLNYTKEEFSRLTISDIDPFESPEEITDSMNRVLKEGKAEFTVRHRTKDGDIRDVYVITQVLTTSGQTLFHTIWRDITERKLSEVALAANEKLLRTIIDAEPECVKLLARNGTLVSMNPAGLSMLEADSLELISGRPMADMVVPEYRGAFRKLNEEVFKGGTGKLEFEATGLRGRRLWLETNAVPLRNEKDEIIALLGITRDITERKLAEAALRESETFLRSVLDNVDEGFLVIAPDYKIVTANKAYCGQVGLNCEEIVGRQCYSVSHKSLKPCHEEGEECAVRHVFETGEARAALHRHRDPAGAIMYVETKAFPLKDSQGKVTSVVETITNITEKQLLEEERLKTQKLEAVGTLAGGIAHDFKNLLQGVFGYMSMARMNLDRKDKAFPLLEQAEKALQMSVSLTAQLLTFSKGGLPAKKRLELPSVVETSARFALSGSRSNYRFTYDKDLWPVEADEGQIGQVIQNVVLNANEAMEGGGIVEIHAGNVDGRQDGDPLQHRTGNFVSIVIRDSGVGIPEHCLSKVFDPYFTTKQKGSGLGLATSYSIIKNHGGIIDVKSLPGKGTTLSICLPAADLEKVSDVPLVPAHPAGRNGRVLVMDDEEAVRRVAAKMLESLGHRATCTEDGQDAIETFMKFEKSGNPFDVVILDLTVKGGMGGEETALKLLELAPEVKIIVSSGYSDSPVVSDYRAHGFVAFLQKPYTIEALANCLNALLPSFCFL